MMILKRDLEFPYIFITKEIFFSYSKNFILRLIDLKIFDNEYSII